MQAAGGDGFPTPCSPSAVPRPDPQEAIDQSQHPYQTR